MRVEKTTTWADNWNNVIRTVIFPDDELLELMMVPDESRVDIIKFVREHFVETAQPDEPVLKQDVLVYYHDTEGDNFGETNYVRKRYLEFDIYVKKENLYNCSSDRMKRRDRQIYERLKYLLTKDNYVCNMRYNVEDDFELLSRTIGYSRYHVIFAYKKTY